MEPITTCFNTLIKFFVDQLKQSLPGWGGIINCTYLENIKKCPSYSHLHFEIISAYLYSIIDNIVIWISSGGLNYQCLDALWKDSSWILAICKMARVDILSWIFLIYASSFYVRMLVNFFKVSMVIVIAIQ